LPSSCPPALLLPLRYLNLNRNIESRHLLPDLGYEKHPIRTRTPRPSTRMSSLFEETFIEVIADCVTDWLLLVATDFIIDSCYLLPDLGYEKHSSPDPHPDTEMSPCEETFIEVIADYVADWLWLVAADFTNHYIITRRDSIVRFGRRWQRRLSIPRYLHVVAEANPGIRYKDIRAAAESVFFAGLMVTVGLLVTSAIPPDSGNIRIAMFLLSVVIFPTLYVLGAWLALAYSQRRLMRKKILRGVAAAERWAAPSCNGVGPRRLGVYL
jgi:hypothetical protein